MPSARITLNKAGVAELLKSDGVKRDIAARLARMKAAAEANPDLPDGIEVSDAVWIGHDRVRGTLAIPAPLEAAHGILSRSIDAAGG